MVLVLRLNLNEIRIDNVISVVDAVIAMPKLSFMLYGITSC